MAGVAGVEPTSTVLETVVLPLNYTPKCLLIIASKKKEFNTEMKKIRFFLIVTKWKEERDLDLWWFCVHSKRMGHSLFDE